MLLGTWQSRAHSMQTNLSESVLASLFISAIVFHTECLLLFLLPIPLSIWTMKEIELVIENDRKKSKREVQRHTERER